MQTILHMCSSRGLAKTGICSNWMHRQYSYQLTWADTDITKFSGIGVELEFVPWHKLR